MAQLIDGKILADKILKDVKKRAAVSSGGFFLKIFLVGDDPASLVYVKKKQDFCHLAGIETEVERLDGGVEQTTLIEKIRLAGKEDRITGIMVQLPLPEGLKEKEVLSAIAKDKDVDCLHPENFGLFCQYGQTGARFLPATALAVMKIFEETGVDLSGKEAVVVGNSNIVGKPLAMLLSAEGATVALCQKTTQDLAWHTARADVLITATGQKNLIQGSMVKPGAVVIDIGITREQGRIFGDVEFESVQPVAGWLTPVPGGVGPVTVAVLAENVLKAGQKSA